MTTVTSAQPEEAGVFSQFHLLTRYPNFGLLWSGQIISHVGDAFHSIALIWLVQEMTGSRTMMGAVSATVSAMALFGLVAGALVDRWDRRLTMLYSDILRALIVLSIPLLAMMGSLEVWQLFIVGAALGLVAQFFYPAKQALIPHLVKPGDLTSANSLSQMAQMLILGAGYGLGGVLLGYISATELFAIDSLTFALSAVTIWLIRMPKAERVPAPADEKQEQESGGFSQLKDDILEGLRFMFRDPLIKTTIPIALIANFIFAPITVLTAAWAKDVAQAGAGGFGFLMGSYLIGNLLGSLSANSLSARFKRGNLIIVSVVLMGLPLILFALIPNLYIDAIIMATIGFFNGIINIILVTLFQQRVPDEMMGRFFGAFSGLIMLLSPLGIALGGIVADVVPLSALFAGIGIAMALLGISMVRRPIIRAIT